MLTVQYFCGQACLLSYRADVLAGIFRLSIKINGQELSHVKAFKQLRLCVYCGSKLAK